MEPIVWMSTAMLVLALAVPIAAYGWSLLWIYIDAKRRGKDGLLVALVVGLLAWPVGLIIWLMSRPPTSEAPSREV